MSGLEKITEHILENAKKIAAENIESAKLKADSINNETKMIADKMQKDAHELIKNDCDKISEMAKASDRQTRKQLLLKAKSDVIKDIINEAKNSLKNMDTQEYLEALKTILKNSINGDVGEILFSPKDKKLIDNGFIKFVSDISQNKLTISDETVNIDSGFIIRYGKIEQNCSVDSIFEEKYNELCDIVNKCLLEE